MSFSICLFKIIFSPMTIFLGFKNFRLMLFFLRNHCFRPLFDLVIMLWLPGFHGLLSDLLLLSAGVPLLHLHSFFIITQLNRIEP